MECVYYLEIYDYEELASTLIKKEKYIGLESDKKIAYMGL